MTQPTKSIIDSINPLAKFLNPAPAPEPARKKLNVTVVLFDMSGSMADLYGKGAVDKYWQSLLVTMKQSAYNLRETQDLLVRVGGFAGQGQYFLDEAKPVEALSFNVGMRYAGWTAMFDAWVAARISTQAKYGSAEDVSFLYLVITDGAENSSTAQGHRQFVDWVGKPGSNETFAFVGPGGVVTELTRRGVPAGNVQEWDGKQESLDGVVTTNTTRGASTYYASTAVGEKSTRTFFLDVSDDAVKKIEAACCERGKFKRLTVNKSQPIADFMAEQRGEYRLGSVFYEVTKREKIQPHKKVVIVNKKTGHTVFTGAMETLGLVPPCSIKPGNFRDYRIYVTSTSMNRRLLEGTTVLVANPGVVTI